MVREGCVTNFNGNCNAENKVKTFRLSRNPEYRKSWITIIPRDNIPGSKNNIVCERRWSKDYSTIANYGKLRPRDRPFVFDCIK